MNFYVASTTAEIEGCTFTRQQTAIAAAAATTQISWKASGCRGNGGSSRSRRLGAGKCDRTGRFDYRKLTKHTVHRESMMT